MTKTLKVVKPFYVMEVDDTFELSEDGQSYVSKYNTEYSSANSDGDNVVEAKYNSIFTISVEYAEELVMGGYLEEVTPVAEKKEDSTFVNVFSEIDSLMSKYAKELSQLNDQDLPACMKVEKETVLRNMIKVLDHLKSLKK